MKIQLPFNLCGECKHVTNNKIEQLLKIYNGFCNNPFVGEIGIQRMTMLGIKVGIDLIISTLK